MNENIQRLNALVVAHWGTERNATVGLTYGYTGGVAFSGGTLVLVGPGTVSLTSLTTNYVERTVAGVVSANTTGWSSGSIPMAKIVTAASTITSIEDWRSLSIAGLNGDWLGRNAQWSGVHTVGGLSTSGGFELASTPIPISALKAGLANAGVADELAIYAKGNIQVYVNGTKCWQVTTAGHLLAGADGTVDIGQAGVQRPRHAFITGKYTGGSIEVIQASNTSIDFIKASNPDTGSSNAVFATLTADNILAQFGASKPSAGAIIGTRSAHPLFVVVNGNTAWQWTSAAHLQPTVDATYDLGVPGARPRDLTISRDLTAGRDLDITGDAVVGGGLDVLGSSSLADVTVGAGLDVTAGSAKAARTTGTWNGTVTENLVTSGNNLERTITGNVSSLTFATPTVGTWYTLILTQDATGGRTVTWPANFRWPYALAPDLGAANVRSIISFYWNGSDYSPIAGGLGM
jgi:hypothetical protein